MHHVGQMSDPSTLSVKGYIKYLSSLGLHTQMHTPLMNTYICVSTTFLFIQNKIIHLPSEYVCVCKVRGFSFQHRIRCHWLKSMRIKGISLRIVFSLDTIDPSFVVIPITSTLGPNYLSLKLVSEVALSSLISDKVIRICG